MKKLFVILFVLTLATGVMFAQVQDQKLGKHDVMGTGASAIYQGCQSCHVPHAAAQDEYLWRHAIPTTITSAGGTVTLPTLDSASFHTNACMSCHDGTTASNVLAITGIAGTAKVFSDALGMINDHPVNQEFTPHGSTVPPTAYVRFYAPSGYTINNPNKSSYDPNLATKFGYIECGSCHDPHKGDANIVYKFLRGPSAGVSQSFAKLSLCRDCHGK